MDSDDSAQIDLATVEDSSYSPEEIEEIKKQGKSKPEGIRWSDWDAPINLTHRHQAIIDDAALGLSATQIAGRVGMTPEHVRKLLRSPIVSEAVRKRRQTSYDGLVRTKLEDLCGLALARLQAVLEDPEARASSAIEAVKLVLEQTIGKPKQKIETHSNILSEVLIKIEAQ